MNEAQWQTMLTSADPQQRRQAIIQMGKSRDPRALSLLGQVHRTDPDPALRDLALQAGRHIRQQMHQAEREAESVAPAIPAAPPASDKDQARARQLFESAIDLRVRGYADRSQRSLADALALNPQLADDDAFRTLAGDLMHLPPAAALEALRQPRSKPGSRRRASASGRPAPGIWRQVRLSVLIMALIGLGGLGYWFVEQGYLDAYWHAYQVRQVTRNPQQTASGQEYFIYVPDGDPPPDGWALVVMMHGYGGNGRDMVQPVFLQMAEAEAAVLIFPTLTTYGYADRDVNRQLRASLHEIIQIVDEQHPLNPQGTILYGFSRGGMFTTEYSLSYPDDIYAIVTDGAPLLYAPPARNPMIPLYAFYGERETYPEHRRHITQHLQATGYPYQFEVVEGAGHSISGIAIQRVVDLIRDMHQSG